VDAVVPLAGQVVAAVAPFLPYLSRAGESVLSRGGDELDAHAWDLAQKLWQRLVPHVQERPSTSEAVQEVVQSPGDDDARAALRVQLRSLLNQQPDLAQQLSAILEQAHQPTQQSVTATHGSIAIGGNVSGSQMIIGDHNRTNR
jgi:hypothetical protein